MRRTEVIGEQGVHPQNTYRRRVRGLMKEGRAYYMTTSCICLFTPPENMEEKTLETDNKKDILTKIDTILQQREYLQEVSSAVEEIPHDLDEELTTIQTKMILEIVEARGKTNQEVAALLHAMPDQDVIPQGE